MSTLKIVFTLCFLFISVAEAENGRVGCHYTSTSGMPSGGSGANYQEALFAAQKNCMENVSSLFKNQISSSKLMSMMQGHCTIPGASQNLLSLNCINFADDREFFQLWKKQVCRYKREVAFGPHLIWSQWYECKD